MAAKHLCRDYIEALLTRANINNNLKNIEGKTTLTIVESFDEDDDNSNIKQQIIYILKEHGATE